MIASTTISTVKTTLQSTTIKEIMTNKTSIVTQVLTVNISNNTQTPVNPITITKGRIEDITTKTRNPRKNIPKKPLLSYTTTVSNVDSNKTFSDNPYKKTFLIIGLTFLGVLVIFMAVYLIILFKEEIKLRTVIQKFE